MTVKKRLIDDLDLDQPNARRWKSEVALARMALSDNKLNDASRLLHKALELSAELKEYDFARGVCQLGLAIVAVHQNRSVEAHQHFEKALNIGRGDPDEKHAALLGVALRQYANTVFDEGEAKQAVAYLEESARVLQKHGVETAYYLALTLCDLAAIYVFQRDFESAQKLLPNVVEILGAIVEPEDADYMRANFIFDLAVSKPDEDEFFELWKANATKMQYQMGAKHPFFVRVLNRFAGMAKKAGREDLIESASAIFAAFPKS